MEFIAKISTGRFNPFTEEIEYIKVVVADDGTATTKVMYSNYHNYTDDVIEVEGIEPDHHDIYVRDANGIMDYQGEEKLIDLYIEAVKARRSH